MEIVFAVKNNEIVENALSTNSDFNQWKSVMVSKFNCFIISIETDDERFLKKDYCKIESGSIVLDQEKIENENHEILRILAKKEKDRKLNSLMVELDGMTFDTRPSDISNFKNAIDIGDNHEWRLADNTRATVTSEQLQQVLDLATPLVVTIENEYTAILPEYSES